MGNALVIGIIERLGDALNSTTFQASLGVSMKSFQN